MITIMIIIISFTLITILYGIFHNHTIKYKKNKVLVVDNDPDILDTVKDILTIHDLDVKTHATGLNVPEIVNKYHPNVVLLDIFLPGKSGIEVCKELKEKNSRLPIIFFSAHAAEKLKSFAMCKANGFIRKPFDIVNLVRTLKLYTK